MAHVSILYTPISELLYSAYLCYLQYLLSNTNITSHACVTKLHQYLAINMIQTKIYLKVNLLSFL